MPYQIEWEPKGLRCTVYGEASMADVVQMFEEVAAHPRFVNLRYRITDFSGVTGHHSNEEEVEDVVGLDFAHSLTNSRMLKASIATDPSILLLLNHWYKTNAHPERLGVFRTMEEAREWIFKHPSMLK